MNPVGQVRIFDSTLRDGEQSPGASMNVAEKLVIAHHLERMRVDVIEAGFPASSPGEFDAVRRISEMIHDCEIAGLCRTREEDIRRAWEAIREAQMPLLHVFIATSPLHMQNKLNMTPAQVLEEVRRAVSMCRALCPRVEFSAEDATRSELAFLKEVFSCAIENGACVINVPDTVGYTMPQEYARMISAMVELVGDRPVVVSAHCHDDLGLAVANSLAAVAAGARQVECCVNGIGERAGNAALEEIVMALQVRSELYGLTTGIDATRIMAVSKLVSKITGLPVQHNKAIVGRNAFSHEAGVHQHAVLHDRRTYEIMRPEDVGLSDNRIVLGKHSGRAALRDRLSTLGYELDDEQIETVFVAFKKLADKKKDVFDDDLHALVGNKLFELAEQYRLEDLEFRSGIDATPWARVTVKDGDGITTAESIGDGPVNAAIQAIKTCTGKDAVGLQEYRLDAITGGSDALGRVTLTISEGGHVSRGQAAHTDVVVASALAFVSALNQQVYQREIRKRLVA